MTDSGLALIAAGLSHRTASLSIREQVSLASEELPAALHRIGGRTGNGVILSTCNRTEVYFVTERDLVAREYALDLFTGATGASHSRVDQHIYHHVDEAAVRHLHNRGLRV